jgi:aspartyl-tRNA(Asn)/glutamyl-tRNA(Gln) amidotransferase subunit C
MEKKMSLDKEKVKKIANLARINVPEKQQEVLAEELTSIIGFVEKLNEVDTTGVEPMTSVANMTLREREDVIKDGGYSADIVKNSADTTDEYFLVPKVVE